MANTNVRVVRERNTNNIVEFDGIRSLDDASIIWEQRETNVSQNYWYLSLSRDSAVV
jgi:hypothetical protein